MSRRLIVRFNVRGLGVAGLIVAAAAVAGCAPDKLTRQNFDTIREGVSDKTEVELTLGNDYQDRGDAWEYEREKKHLSVYVHFDERGRVIRKEWIDAKTGEWEGAAPGIDETPQGRPAGESTRTKTIRKD
jgi:hypothetical protein